MASEGRGRFLAGLDIGTTKVTTVIAEARREKTLRLLGLGRAPSEGMRRGMVINLEAMIEAVRASVKAGEEAAGVPVRRLSVGIAGEHIRSINSRGVIAVGGYDDEITPDDAQRVIEAARTIAIPADRDILHVLPQEYAVDDQTGILDPTGMSGMRLEVEVHIITGAASATRNICRCVERAGYQVEQLVLDALASAEAVLDPDEKRLGVVVLDVGADTTGLTVFAGGALRHSAVLGMGSAQVTHDIAVGLRTSLEQAEMLKIQHGCAYSAVAAGQRATTVALHDVGGTRRRQVSTNVLVAIIEPRMEELLTLARQEVERNYGGGMLAAGLVLTGGGALLRGTVELAEQIFELPARVGHPWGLECAAAPGWVEVTEAAGAVRQAEAGGGMQPSEQPELPQQLGLCDQLQAPEMDPRHAAAVGLLRHAAAQSGGSARPPRQTSRKWGLRPFREWVRTYLQI